MAQGSVVVVGSLNYDLLVTGAPVPRGGETVAAEAWRPACGGKGGNQATEAARHGARVAMVAAVGADPMGDTLVANLQAAGVDTAAVLRAPDKASGLAVVMFDAARDCRIIVVPAANAALTAETIAGAADVLAGAKVLVTQNETPADANAAAARAARAAGASVIWNAAPAAGADAAMLAATDILVVNQLEAETFGAAPVLTLEDAAAAARDIARLVPTAIVTAGGHGLAVASGERVHTLIAHRVQLHSTLGAGDAFCGALAARLAAGAGLADAVLYANAAAASLVATPEEARAALTAADAERLLASGPPLLSA